MMGAALIAAALSGASGPPAPVLGAPVAIGRQVTSASATTIVITTDVEAPAGERVIVYCDTHAGVGPVSLVDSGGRTWTQGTFINQGGFKGAYWTDLVAPMTVGTTITLTAGASARCNMLAFYAPGLSGGAVDTRAATLGGGTFTAPSTNPPTITSAALASGKEKLVLGVVELAGAALDSEITEAAGWTKLDSIGGTLWHLHLAYKLVDAATTTAQIYAPTLSTTRNWVTDILSFKAA